MATKRRLRSSTSTAETKKLKSENADLPAAKAKAVKEDEPKEEAESRGPRYWLMKAEPTTRLENGHDVKFSIDDLKLLGHDCWDGVRNAEASKTMRVRMKLNDRVFFYHSNAGAQTGIAGLAVVCKEGYPDESAWDKTHPYYDAKSDPDKPKWYRVDVKYERHLKRLIGLQELKQYKEKELSKMVLLRRAQLSVQPVTQEECDFVLSLEEKEPEAEATAESSKGRQYKKRSEMTDADIKAEIDFTHGG